MEMQMPSGLHTIKQKANFRRIFNLNIPLQEHFEYYITQLSHLYKHRDLMMYLDLFAFQEDFYEDILGTKDLLSSNVISYINSTKAYRNFLDYNIQSTPSEIKNSVYEPGKLYMSIDLKFANFNVLKSFDDLNELGDDYNKLLDKFNAPTILHYCKGMRQYIFGNLDPKKNSRIQKEWIALICEELIEHNVVIHNMNNDEVVVEYTKDFPHELLNDDKFRSTIYTNTTVGDMTIRQIYGRDMEPIDKMIDIIGGNGDMVYYNIKKYITGQEIEIRDMYFRYNKNTMAIMVTPETKALLNI